MPIEELHKKKKKKNLVILGLIVLWCVVIFFVTMVRVAGAEELRDYPEYIEGRGAHQTGMMNMHNAWLEDYASKTPMRENVLNTMNEGRATHLAATHSASEQFVTDYEDLAPMRIARDDARESGREAHLQNMMPRPQNWWDDWSTRQPYDKNQ